MKYFIPFYVKKKNNTSLSGIKNGYDSLTHNIVTYYITRTGHIRVRIPVDEYTAKYKAKERDKKLESIGI